MDCRIWYTSALIAAILAPLLVPCATMAQIAVSANDGKAVLVEGVNKIPSNPTPDTVTIIDLSASPPKVLAELKAPSSVVGPPQNVAITPDESIALVSANMKLDPADPQKLVPDNRVSVIDLKANPPTVIATVEAGSSPAGISINRTGTMALVANRGDGTVSIFTITGKTLTPAGKVDFGNPKAGPSSAAFSADGKTALVTRDGDHKISILSIDGTKVEDTKRMLTGGIRPYPVQVSPRGDIAAVGNQGGGAGDIDTINIVSLAEKAPRIVHTHDVGQIVEGLVFSADGSHLAVTAQDGSNRPASHPFYNPNGLLVVFKVDGTTMTKVAEVRVAKWDQGVAWSRDGKTLMVQSMAEQLLSVVSFDGHNLKVIGELKVSGGPEGIRTAER
jgi:DNA-binding beta-propeller fold protein YncE